MTRPYTLHHRTSRLAVGALAFLVVLGCGRAVGTAGTPPLDSDDTRDAYLGDWQLEFALDSTREPGRKPNEWSPATDSSARARGTVTVRDSLLDPEDTPLAADYTLDFTPLLGRQVSCLGPDAGGIDVEEEGDSVFLWFTPRALLRRRPPSGRHAGRHLGGGIPRGTGRARAVPDVAPVALPARCVFIQHLRSDPWPPL